MLNKPRVKSKIFTKQLDFFGRYLPLTLEPTVHSLESKRITTISSYYAEL